MRARREPSQRRFSECSRVVRGEGGCQSWLLVAPPQRLLRRGGGGLGRIRGVVVLMEDTFKNLGRFWGAVFWVRFGDGYPEHLLWPPVPMILGGVVRVGLARTKGAILGANPAPSW